MSSVQETVGSYIVNEIHRTRVEKMATNGRHHATLMPPPIRMIPPFVVKQHRLLMRSHARVRFERVPMMKMRKIMTIIQFIYRRIVDELFRIVWNETWKIIMMKVYTKNLTRRFTLFVRLVVNGCQTRYARIVGFAFERYLKIAIVLSGL